MMFRLGVFAQDPLLVKPVVDGPVRALQDQAHQLLCIGCGAGSHGIEIGRSSFDLAGEGDGNRSCKEVWAASP